MADRAGTGQGPEAGVAVSGSFHDAGVSVSVGERMEDAAGAGVGVNAGKAVSEYINSRPVIRRPRLGVD